MPFEPGESLVYRVTWDAPTGALEAGEVSFEVEAAAPGQYRLAAGARTAPWIARFFEADDRFTTTTDAALIPLVHERRIREGRRALGRQGPQRKRAAAGRRPTAKDEHVVSGSAFRRLPAGRRGRRRRSAGGRVGSPAWLAHGRMAGR